MALGVFGCGHGGSGPQRKGLFGGQLVEFTVSVTQKRICFPKVHQYQKSKFLVIRFLITSPNALKHTLPEKKCDWLLCSDLHVYNIQIMIPTRVTL